MHEYSTDWANINLDSPCQRDLNLIDGLSFESFLLEVHCNLPEINEETVTAQFNEDINRIVESAKEVFKDNLQNIINYAQKERNEC